MATTSTSIKFNKSEVFKAAWALVKKVGIKFPDALRQVWAYFKGLTEEVALRIGAKVLVGKEQPELVVECSSFRQPVRATDSQYKYLRSFKNVSMKCNVHTFVTGMSRMDASSLINEAIAGRNVVVYA